MKKITSLIIALSLAASQSLAHGDPGFSEEASAPPVKYEFNQAELEQILAPIALYPDSLLTHILIASTYPLELVQANRWWQNNSDIETSAIEQAIQDKDWDPSVKALVPFPRVLERLSDDLNWTQKLGDAFLQNEAKVLAGIQSLRAKADRAGSLDNMENMKVSREENTIIIRSAQPEVIYVPYYDTRVVYGPWYWHHYPPVYWDLSWHHHHNHHHYISHHGLFSWHPSVHISFGFFFNAFHWHNRHIVVFNHHKHARYSYRHHRKVINHRVKRWHHNPVHRRGVAYRTAHVKQKFHSNRPSKVNSTRVRAREQQLIASRKYQDSGLSASRVSAAKVHKAKAVKTLTRHERLKGQIKHSQSKHKVSQDKNRLDRHKPARVKHGSSGLQAGKAVPNKSKAYIHKQPYKKEKAKARHQTNVRQKEYKRAWDNSNNKASHQANAKQKQHKQVSLGNNYKASHKTGKHYNSSSAKGHKTYSGSKTRSTTSQRSKSSQSKQHK